ncbi:putative Pentatricopeptide repeat superfamily protein [Hibiscus syriacus]|uniref:Pentatricopeptide repeat superfamily protein n=1 Tax=Hibiscus syriacus TaxID=106335 RepID=A0A6A3B3P1_HIBSY|nr:putative Pentatricopeptide repeat superfamily protein [Hibiscus syriacus]
MADPGSFDPIDIEYTHEVLNFLDIQNPTLDDLTTNELPFLYPQSTDPVHNNAIDDFEDPVISEFCNEPNPEISQVASLVTVNDQRETRFGTNANSMPLSVWPSDAVPFRCSCCQSLREIVHTNGIDVTKLEIHGRLGMIYHAILTIEPDSSTSDPPYQMFDFCQKSIEDVKQFLIQYCIDRSQAGYMMIKDPLENFYEALCIGFEWDENLYNGDHFIQPLSSNSGGVQMVEEAGNSNNNQEKPTKPCLAIQRERTRKLTLKEIENYFHLPIEQAAKKLEFSATVIQSMEKQICNWESRLSSNDPEERGRAEIEIQNLKREIAKFRDGSGKATS